jgi:hypothetical protein
MNERQDEQNAKPAAAVKPEEGFLDDKRPEAARRNSLDCEKDGMRSEVA